MTTLYLLKIKNCKLRIKNYKLKIIFVVLIFSLFIVQYHNPVTAQESLPLIVSPARQELLVDPGETTSITLKFLNESLFPVSGLLNAQDFIVEDKNGSPTFIDEGTPTTNRASRFAASSWVTLPYQRVAIAAKNKVLIQAKIKVPENARPGGHYFAVYFEPNTALTGGQNTKESAVSPRIASLIYLKVSGPIRSAGYVSKMTAPQFSEYGPIVINSEITNLSVYHITPKGNLTMTNLFNQVVDQSKLEELNIFPDISRLYSNKLGSKWMFGQYKTVLNATYGPQGKLLTATIFFWVLPWRLLLALLLAFAILIMLLKVTFGRLQKHESELEDKVAELEKEIQQEKQN